MKRSLVGVLSLALVAGFALSAPAEERIKGADMVKPGMSFDKLFVALLPVEVNKTEFDLFMDNMETYEGWGAEDPEKWNSADGAEDPIAVILSWEDWWKTSELTGKESVAMVIKLEVARQVASGGFEGLEEGVKQMEGALASPHMPEEQKTELKGQIEEMKKIVAGLKAYPEANKKFYKDNKEAVDKALERFNDIGEDGEEGEGEEEEEEEGMEEVPK